MSFEKLITLITEGYRPDYYLLLIDNYTIIIREVKATTQKKVATRLKLSEAKFSVVFNMLLAIEHKAK